MAVVVKKQQKPQLRERHLYRRRLTGMKQDQGWRRLQLTGGAGTAGTETSAADGQTAGEGETVAPEEVVEDWMVPIAGDQVKDGEYDVEVKSSSSMFKITDCRLTVKDGEMTAVLDYERNRVFPVVYGNRGKKR